MKTAQILVHLGAPADFSIGAADAFLREFLSDAAVLSMPSFIRKPLSRRIAKKRAGVYLENLKKTSINGLVRTQVLMNSLAKKVSEITSCDTYVASRYGVGNIPETITKLRLDGIKNFKFLPMYPQYANCTVGTIKKEVFANRKSGENFLFCDSYYDNPIYIANLAKLLNGYGGKVLASFHSIPIKQDKDKKYSTQCLRTIELLADAAGLKNIEIVWQSKMGKCVKWLEPSAENRAVELANAGVKKLGVICAGFPLDCTETLIEIDTDLRSVFFEAGGDEFSYFQCLNDTREQAEIISDVFERLR